MGGLVIKLDNRPSKSFPEFRQGKIHMTCGLEKGRKGEQLAGILRGSGEARC